MKKTLKILLIIGIIFIASILWLWLGPPSKKGPIDLEGFRKLIKDAECADLKNQLYAINDQYVFW